jgi:hypothetical protein
LDTAENADASSVLTPYGIEKARKDINVKVKHNAMVRKVEKAKESDPEAAKCKEQVARNIELATKHEILVFAEDASSAVKRERKMLAGWGPSWGIKNADVRQTVFERYSEYLVAKDEGSPNALWFLAEANNLAIRAKAMEAAAKASEDAAKRAPTKADLADIKLARARDAEDRIRKAEHEKGRRQGFVNGLQVGHKQGYRMGAQVGHEQGAQVGHRQGFEMGAELGYEQGLDAGAKAVVRNVLPCRFGPNCRSFSTGVPCKFAH